MCRRGPGANVGAAGKWLFAAYVAQRRQGNLGPGDAMVLNMTRLNVIACRGALTRRAWRTARSQE